MSEKIEDLKTCIIKWFDGIKGYGFLVDEKGNDIFIHNSQIQNILTEGVKVLCEVFETPNGLRAKNVRIVTLAELPERVSEES